MKIEQRKIEDVVPYEKNPRNNDKAVDKVAMSLKEYGWQQPIVVDTDGVVIAGHTRLRAAEQLGMTKVPVTVATDLSPAQVKAYRIADNKTAEFADWDTELLGLELGGLKDLDFDIELTGFSEKEFVQFIANPNDPEEEDEPPAPPEDPRSELGHIYTLGRHKLLCGDATDKAVVEKLFNGSKAQMCFTDPPWNVGIGQDSNPKHRQREGLVNDNLSEEDHKAFLNGFINVLATVLEGDLYCVFCAAQWPVIDLCLRDQGFHWSTSIIWVKDVFVLGRSKYHRRYEPIWYGWGSSTKSSYRGGRAEDDVWEIPRPKRSEEHPTMKPVELVTRAIRNSSESNDIIYDPFLGSGTTLIAADQLGRTCYGMEIEPRYIDVTIQRYCNLVDADADAIFEAGKGD